jgi:hypothetical protein
MGEGSGAVQIVSNILRTAAVGRLPDELTPAVGVVGDVHIVTLGRCRQRVAKRRDGGERVEVAVD